MTSNSSFLESLYHSAISYGHRVDSMDYIPESSIMLCFSTISSSAETCSWDIMEFELQEPLEETTDKCPLQSFRDLFKNVRG